MKRIVLAVAILSCLSACGKKESSVQKKGSEPVPVQQAFKAPTEWTPVEQMKQGGQINTLYYRAVPTDETVKGVKVEIAGQVEDDFKKTPIVPHRSYAFVNCEKQAAKKYTDVDSQIIADPVELNRLLKFACGIEPKLTITDTNAAAQVQSPKDSQQLVDRADGDEAQYRMVKAEASRANARFAAAWRMVPQPLRNQLQQDISYMPKEVDAKCKAYANQFGKGYSRKAAYLKCSVAHEENLSNGIERFARAYQVDQGARFEDYVNDQKVFNVENFDIAQ